IPLSAMAGAPTFPPSETAWRVAGIKARVSQEGRGKGVRPRGVRAHPSLKNAKDGAPSSSWDERRDLSENTEKRNPGAQSGATVPQGRRRQKARRGGGYLRAISGEATLDSEAQVMSRGMKGVTASGLLGRMRMAQPKKPLFFVRREARKR